MIYMNIYIIKIKRVQARLKAKITQVLVKNEGNTFSQNEGIQCL